MAINVVQPNGNVLEIDVNNGPSPRCGCQAVNGVCRCCGDNPRRSVRKPSLFVGDLLDVLGLAAIAIIAFAACWGFARITHCLGTN